MFVDGERAQQTASTDTDLVSRTTFVDLVHKNLSALFNS